LLPADDVGEIETRKKEICDSFGLEGIFPSTPAEEIDHRRSRVDPRSGHVNFSNCLKMMDSCDLVIANMTPFRGVSMDVGTAVEVGYMLGKNRPVFGYANFGMGQASDYSARVQKSLPDDEFIREPFGFVDNLMCQGAVWISESYVVRTIVGTQSARSPDASPRELLQDLTGFERCASEAASTPNSGGLTVHWPGWQGMNERDLRRRARAYAMQVTQEPDRARRRRTHRQSVDALVELGEENGIRLALASLASRTVPIDLSARALLFSAARSAAGRRLARRRHTDQSSRGEPTISSSGGKRA